jgi:hypothetical protein
MLIVWLLLMLSVGAEAASIQYLNNINGGTGGEVTACTNNGIAPVPGYGVVVLTEMCSQIVWPVPNGCPAGKLEWTRVTNPSAVTAAGAGMAVRTGFTFFQTTSTLMEVCTPVNTKRDLNLLVDEAIIKANSDPNFSLVTALGGHNSWHQALCLDVNGSGGLIWSTNANCVTWKANLDVVNAELPGRGQGVTLSGQMQILVTDKKNFLAAQCKANPGGPFC